MFVGHYGVSFAAKRLEPSVPLWVLFLAVQFLDVIWAPLVLLGVEKVRIVPGITETNALDLYYMPFTHSLVGALAWSAAAGLLYQLLARPVRQRASWIVALAVFSHWILDFLVHRPDLPLYDDTAKVGLGLWNYPALAFGLEAAFLFVGMWYCLGERMRRSIGTLVFGAVMLAMQAYTFFGPLPSSGNAVASTAIVAYAVYALVIWWLQDRRAPRTAS